MEVLAVIALDSPIISQSQPFPFLFSDKISRAEIGPVGERASGGAEMENPVI